MDQKRPVLAIAVSLAIMLGFQAFVAPYLPKPPPPTQITAGAPASLSSGSSTGTSPGTSTGTTASTEAQSGSEQEANRVPANTPRVSVPINAKKLTGSINLVGARLDDVVLSDYREKPTAGFAARSVAGAAIRRTTIFRAILLGRPGWSDRRTAARRHRLDNLGWPAHQWREGHADLEQWPGSDVPDRIRDRR